MVVFAAAGSAGLPAASADDATSTCLPGLAEISCGGEISSGFGGSGGGDGSPVVPVTATTVPARDQYAAGELTTGADGNPCVTFVEVTSPDGADLLAPAAEIAAIDLMARYPVCAGTAVPAAITANPAAYAAAFWQTIPLPVPAPSIPPGKAITGLPAYLVTGGTTSPAPFTEATPLGQLTVTAHGTYTVDWGDHVTSGPYASEGQPYPHGTLSHTYDTATTVTVTVTENWTATWALGDAHGTLTGLHTQAAIPRFTVEQVQAVITSNS